VHPADNKVHYPAGEELNLSFLSTSSSAAKSDAQKFVDIVERVCNAEISTLKKYFAADTSKSKSSDLLAHLTDVCETLKAEAPKFADNDEDITFEPEQNSKDTRQSNTLTTALHNLTEINNSLDKYLEDPSLLCAERNIWTSSQNVGKLPAVEVRWIKNLNMR
jgi:hypothetical protein